MNANASSGDDRGRYRPSGASNRRAAELLVFDLSGIGHRGRDANVLATLLGGRVLLQTLPGALGALLGHRGPLLWQTADYVPLWFTALAIGRSLAGRKTVALCYRNNWSADGKPLKRALRRALFRVWNAIPFCTALSVCPAPEMRKTRHFLYDIEWWDLSAAPLARKEVPAVGSNGSAKGPTLVFLGSASEPKGIDFFARAALEAAKAGSAWQFAIVGNTGRLTSQQQDMLGAAAVTIRPGPPDDESFVSFIAQADLVWSCYRPSYDQSSGIFGRSLQLGKPTVVRKGSLLEACQREFGAGIAVDYGDTAGLVKALETALAANPPRPAIGEAFLNEARRKLREACWS